MHCSQDIVLEVGRWPVFLVRTCCCPGTWAEPLLFDEVAFFLQILACLLAGIGECESRIVGPVCSKVWEVMMDDQKVREASLHF